MSKKITCICESKLLLIYTGINKFFNTIIIFHSSYHPQGQPCSFFDTQVIVAVHGDESGEI